MFPDGSPVTLEPNGFLDPGPMPQRSWVGRHVQCTSLSRIAALMGAAAFLGGSGRAGALVFWLAGLDGLLASGHSLHHRHDGRDYRRSSNLPASGCKQFARATSCGLLLNDPQVMIFPVGFSTVFAVLVGNLINHGLYHSLIDAGSQVVAVRHALSQRSSRLEGVEARFRWASVTESSCKFFLPWCAVSPHCFMVHFSSETWPYS